LIFFCSLRRETAIKETNKKEKLYDCSFVQHLEKNKDLLYSIVFYKKPIRGKKERKKMKKLDEKTMDHVDAFLDLINKNFQNYCDRAKLTFAKKEYFAIKTIGRKYIQIAQFNEKGDCAYAHSFINMKNGNIYKPASWKAPAKHHRGNIFIEYGKGALAGNGGRHVARYL